MCDLRGDGPVRMGIPSDVAGGSNQTRACGWSAAFHQHPQEVDGIIYPSRLNGEHNLAIYGRAVSALRCTGTVPLLGAKELVEVLRDLKVALA